ncbi:purine/pyrimidine permease [Roseomonas sp. SSH11]|uniref:Purine/pyrimidine permease n=1 Tax=Pararoseomonas baculiformis TaxID=2820812 RepID=A0ABS4AHQ1_9PROT|nr:solute carrier family 23 protein [Pararoseomonas baculiformis]MBP0446521.1 purine/pyrimidine permease [Pararoseomonas baculiformis]
MKSLLDRFLPPPAPPKRHRPEELLYAIDEAPPRGLTFSMGLQHAALSLMFILYALVAAQGIGLGPAETNAFVSATIFLLGAATLLQAVPSRLGAGMLLVAIPAPAKLPIFIGVVGAYGLGAAMGATIVSAVAAILFARMIPRLRAFFPPEVLGVVVVMLGLSLVGAGLSRGVGLSVTGAVSGAALASAAATIACIIAASLWGPPGLRRLAVVVGAAAGTVVALLAGAAQPGGAAALSSLPMLAMPILGRELPAPEFLLVPIAVFLVSQLIGVMDVFGSVLSMDKMNDARWRRVDMTLVARAVTALGLMHILQGFAGVLASAISSANLGLAHATGITAWRVGMAAGVVLMVVAFVPPITGLIALTPAPVIGGILIYTASYLIVAGMGLATSRMMNTQRSFTVGLALVCGTGVMLVPALAEASPDWSRIIVSSGLTMGSVAAVGLNAVLRIGVKRTAELSLDPKDETRAAAEFLEQQGRAWGARAEVVVRAGVALGEALEALRQSGVDGPVRLSASFDEFNLRCRLIHAGRALPLGGGAAPDARTLLEADEGDALDAAMRRVSATLIARLADRVRAVERNGTAEVIFDFEH